MAYTGTNWQDKIVQNPLTFDVQNNPDGSITLIPKPGAVTQAGTPVNAANLNKLEDNLKTVFDDVEAGTSAVTANKLIRYNSAGRAKIAAPVASDDIARLDTVNSVVSSAVAAVNNSVSGYVSFSDTIPAGSTLTKNIPMGATYKRANLVMRGITNTASARVFCGTDSAKTTASGNVKYSSSSPYGDWSRRRVGAVVKDPYGHIYVASGYNNSCTGNYFLELSECYLSGSNIRLDYKNTDTTARNLDTEIDWEAWN